MPAYCNICPPKLQRGPAPALIACKNCGQFACDAHRHLWQNGRSWFCSECWFDSAGQSFDDVASAMEQAIQARVPSPLDFDDVMPLLRDTLRRIRADEVLRSYLAFAADDAAQALSLVLRRVSRILTEYRLRWLLRFLVYLKIRGVEDPDVDWHIASLQSDPQRMHAARESGANPETSVAALLDRHERYRREFPER